MFLFPSTVSQPSHSSTYDFHAQMMDISTVYVRIYGRLNFISILRFSTLFKGRKMSVKWKMPVFRMELFFPLDVLGSFRNGYETEYFHRMRIKSLTMMIMIAVFKFIRSFSISQKAPERSFTLMR